MKRFYLLWRGRVAIFQTPSEKSVGGAISQALPAGSRNPFTLSWSHYTLLRTSGFAGQVGIDPDTDSDPDPDISLPSGATLRLLFSIFPRKSRKRHCFTNLCPIKKPLPGSRSTKLLEAAGWRFFADGNGPANIRLEPSVAIKPADLDSLGVDFEKAGRGFVDFLLLDARGFPLIVLEAKAENKNPLVGKEQARKYARSQNCRFVILSNGNLHYFWDLERGNPYVITSFPTPDSVTGYKKVTRIPSA
jgi:hypothetical protein